ncbi:hypothetical protein UT300012_24220 [Paraclostridium bifermentans]
MILNKTIVRNDLANLSEFGDRLFEDCMNSFKYLVGLEKIMMTEKEYNEKNEEPIDDFSYNQLDVLEEQDDLGDLKAIGAFVVGVGSKDGSSHRRLDRFAQEFNNFRRLAREYADDYVPLDKKQIAEVADYVNQAIGQLAYYMYYQFNMGDFLEDVEAEKEDYRTDLAVFNYCDRHDIKVEDLINLVNEIRLTHKPQLPVFDECPDLENEFFDVAGPYIDDYELLESKLTVADVRAILSGNVDVAKTIAEIMQRTADEE